MQFGNETARPDVQALVPASARTTLNLGCSATRLGAVLKARQGAAVMGAARRRREWLARTPLRPYLAPQLVLTAVKG